MARDRVRGASVSFDRLHRCADPSQIFDPQSRTTDRARRGQAAGAIGKALKLWRNDPTAYQMSWRSPEFYSNRVMLGFALISIVIGLMAVAVR
jgi:hypothetical protein